MSDERTFTERALDSINAFRKQDPFVTLGNLVESKSGAQYPARNTQSIWPGNFQGSRVDYKQEAGELTGSSLVMAVVNFTATTLPEAKFQMMKKTGDDLAPDPEHKLTKLMKRPNTYMSGETLMSAFSVSWWIDGNVYLFAVPNNRKEIAQLWYYPHYLIEPRWPGDGKSPTIQKNHRLTPDGWVVDDEDVFISAYEYTVDGKKFLLPPEQIIHFRRGVNPQNIRKGLGAFDSVLREIYGDNATANFSAALMRNYGVANYLVTPKDGTMDEADAITNKARFDEKTRGDNRGSAIFNTMAMEVQQLSFNPQELDLSKLRYVPESRVAAVTGIPAAVLQFMVGLENGTSYASYEQAKLQAYESVIFPIQNNFLSEIDAQLLPWFENPPTSESAFDYSRVRILQEDRTKAVQRAVTAYRGGLVTRARSKAWINEPFDAVADNVYAVNPASIEPTKEEVDRALADLEKSIRA